MQDDPVADPGQSPAPSVSTAPQADPTTDFDAALGAASSDLQTQLQTSANADAATQGPIDKFANMLGSASDGVIKGVVNTLNMPHDLGLPIGKINPMSVPGLKDVYADSAMLDREGMQNSMGDSVGQFAAGLVGAGKVMGALKVGEALEGAGVVGKVVKGALATGTAAFTALDPQQQRLSDLVQSVPQLRNPINAYLASNPNDSAASGRLKNALENAGLEAGVISTLGYSLKALKAATSFAKGAGSADDVAKAMTDLNEVTQGRAPGTDDQVAPTDPVATKAADGTAPAYTTPPVAEPADDGFQFHGSPGALKVVVRGANPILPEDAADAGGAADRSVGVPDAAAGGSGGDGTVGAPQVTPAKTIIGAARSTGQLTGKVSADVLKQADSAVEAAPKINTNGVGFTVLPRKSMDALGKTVGVDTSKWMAAAHNGQVIVADDVMKMAPADQARIIAHEVGHVLQPQFLKAAGARALPKAELVAASRALRPEAYDAAVSKAGTKAGHQAAQYLSKGEEQFADSFALWKTDPAKMAEVAPKTKALFDEHFQPWIDTDLTTMAGDTAGAAKPEAQGFQPQHIIEPSDTERMLKGYDADQAALSQYGSRANAEEAGHTFAPSSLPWQKLQGTADYQMFHNQVTADLKVPLDAMKDGDVLHDTRVNAMIAQSVKLFNDDPTLLMGQLQAAGHQANTLVSNMEAAFLVANRAADDVYSLVKQVKAGNFADFGGDAAAAKQAIGQRLSLFVEATGNAQAMRAAIGRGMRRLQGKFQVDPQVLASIQSMDPDQLANLVNMSGGDPRLLAGMVAPGFWKRALDAAGTMFANNLLWQWPTHVRNMLGNVFMLGTTPAMRAVGSFAVRGSAGQDVRTIALREYRYMFSSMSDVFDATRQAYIHGDGILNANSNEYFRSAATNQPTGTAGDLAASIGLKPMTTLGDFYSNAFHALGFALKQPTRVLGMADEFIKQMSYRASVLAKASLDADKLGLQGKDYGEYLQKTLSSAFDEEGHATDQAALYDAQVRTFQQPLLPGLSGGQEIAGLVNRNPGLRFVLPFVRTPINLVRYAWKMTPGLNVLSTEYRQMISGALGPEKKADAWGQMAMGVAASSSIMGLANAGMITGGAPPTPGDAKALMDTGWKPYAFMTTNPDGSHEYVPFNQIDPIGMLFGIVADVHQIYSQDQVSGQGLDKAVLPIVIAIAKNITDRTYLQSLTQTFDAVSDPDQGGAARMIGNTAAGMVPFSSLLKEANPDPYMRDVRGILDTVMAGLPGFSQKLPPRRDAFGAPVKRVTNIAFSDTANDVVDAEQQRMLTNFGIGITPPSPSVAGQVDLRNITLPDGRTAFDRYQELSQQPQGASQTMKAALADVIRSPEYQKLPDGDGNTKGTKLWELGAIVRKYRTAALKQLQQDNPSVGQQMAAKQQAVREAYRNAQAGQDANNDKYNTVISTALKATNRAFGIN